MLAGQKGERFSNQKGRPMKPQNEKVYGVAAGRIISTMVERIVTGFQPLRIILFGSHARGTATPGSDVDLLVVLPDVRDNREATVAIRQALGDLPASKDIVVTTPDEITRRGRLVGTVLRAALREGKVVYERS